MERETWGGFDFVLSLIGFSVGYGNFWRFPYLCFKNGGGAFLIPYFICVVLFGVTMVLLEVALGQFMRSGCITAWNIVPIFQGVGYACAVMMNWLIIYYIVIVAWSFYYMFSSFTSVLPWSHCNNPWNTNLCADGSDSGHGGNVTSNDTATSASQEFWERKILRLSDGIDEPGSVSWQLFLCLLLSWIVCYLSAFKGIKSASKALYVTVTIKYVLLLVLAVQAVTLDGARDGLHFYVNIDIYKLSDGQVWHDAVTQVLFSYSLGIGMLTALGSYNKYHKNMYRSCMTFVIVNAFTSLLSGVVIFSVLGFLAKQQGITVAEAADSGPSLVFVAYPAAAAKMPLAQLWSVLFFLMLVSLGIDSQYLTVIGFITAMTDLFPQHLNKRHRKEIFTGIMCVIWFLIGLCMLTKGGMYVFQLFDSFAASGFTLLLLVICESVAIGWFYGSDLFLDYMAGMNGYHMGPWIKVAWMYIVPIFCSVSFIYGLVTYKRLKFDTYEFPAWSQAIGFMITLSSVVLIPVVAIVKFVRTKGTPRERWTKLTTIQMPENIRKLEEEQGKVEVGRNPVERLSLVGQNT